MRRCKAKPYEGNKEYIFVSYCHKDKESVFPIIERLNKEGYRIWYDEGIDPGTEWPEIIANHLNQCEVCIVFVSTNSNNSHNCRREITFALLKKKICLSVYIEEVQLSLGMEMQLSSMQAVFKYSYDTNEQFMNVLLETCILHSCLGDPNPGIVISNETKCDEEIRQPIEYNSKSFSNKWLVNSDENKCSSEIYDVPELIKNVLVLKRDATDERIEINKKEFRIGRSAEFCDYVILSNKNISRVHATIILENDDYYITDNNSSNKTFVNLRQVEPDQRVKIDDSSFIEIADEVFKAEILTKKTCRYFLIRIKTAERIEITKEVFRVGKNQEKCDYIIADNSAVSRYHADIILMNNKCYVKDHNSTNKTFVNKTAVEPDCEVELKNKDEIKIADEAFILEVGE